MESREVSKARLSLKAVPAYKSNDYIDFSESTGCRAADTRSQVLVQEDLGSVPAQLFCAIRAAPLDFSGLPRIEGSIDVTSQTFRLGDRFPLHCSDLCGCLHGLPSCPSGRGGSASG